MIGGFLGAGKTTAVGQLAEFLTKRDLTVGLITNDQSSGLVDSSILRGQGHEVDEIAGGCFCCRFHSLNEAVERLNERTRPDVFIAEPVGSCTDLVATVSYPLRRIYGEDCAIAPLSVLVDPARARRILGLEEGRSFSPKVVYVYRKQLEEAQFILINKIDELEPAQQDELQAALEREFPQAEVLRCSAKQGDGLEAWFARILDEDCATGETMALDYKLYAEGEALLGWLNCTVGLESDGAFDANALLVELTRDLQRRAATSGIEIAHLKMTLDARDGGGQLAVVSLVRTDGELDVRESLLDTVEGGSLIINLRAEGDPELLQEHCEASLKTAVTARPGLRTRVDHLEFFRPAAPTPVERITNPAEVLK